jgi:mono/diheme cytochrome c family protein
MTRVSAGLLGCVAIGWFLAIGAALAQTPALPKDVPAEARKLKAAVPSSPAAIEAGKGLYAKYCRFCHGDTGLGDGRLAPKGSKPSNLTDTEWTRGSSEGEIFWIIQNGAPPDYQMKGLKGKVSDTDTWNIVHFVRSLGGVK